MTYPCKLRADRTYRRSHEQVWHLFPMSVPPLALEDSRKRRSHLYANTKARKPDILCSGLVPGEALGDSWITLRQRVRLKNLSCPESDLSIDRYPAASAVTLSTTQACNSRSINRRATMFSERCSSCYYVHHTTLSLIQTEIHAMH